MVDVRFLSRQLPSVRSQVFKFTPFYSFFQSCAHCSLSFLFDTPAEHLSCAPSRSYITLLIDKHNAFGEHKLPLNTKMKFSTILVGAFAALAAAMPAPAAEPETEVAALEARRKNIDAGRLNNLNFKQQDINYLFNINSLDLGLFQQLGINNNLNVLVFQDLFNSGVFNLESLLLFQQLQTLLLIGRTGVFNTFDLSGLNLAGLNLGLVNGLGGVELGQFIDAGLRPQVAAIAAKVTPTVIIA